MGLTTACQAFNWIIKEIKAFFGMFRVQLHQYLDDWIMHAGDCQTLVYITQKVVLVTEAFSFIINQRKSELSLTQDCVYLAYRFCRADNFVLPTESRWAKMQQAVQSMLTACRMPAWKWQSILGLLTATEKVVHFGMLCLRDIQRAVLGQWYPWSGDPREKLLVTDKVKEALS